jgi:hypothetical protein
MQQVIFALSCILRYVSSLGNYKHPLSQLPPSRRRHCQTFFLFSPYGPLHAILVEPPDPTFSVTSVVEPAPMNDSRVFPVKSSHTQSTVVESARSPVESAPLHCTPHQRRLYFRSRQFFSRRQRVSQLHYNLSSSLRPTQLHCNLTSAKAEVACSTQLHCALASHISEENLHWDSQLQVQGSKLLFFCALRSCTTL